jgi:hypothetical protein
MISFAKFIIGLISAVILLVISYFIFKTNRVFDVILPKGDGAQSVREAVLGVRDKIYGKIDELIAPLRNKANEAVDETLGNAKAEVDEIVAKAKQGAAESIKKSLNEKIDTISGKSYVVGEGLFGGAANFSSSVSREAPADNIVDNFPLGFSVKRGLPAVFIVKSLADDKSGFSYSVIWGDGKKDIGEVAPGGATTIYHIWEKEGEYNIKIETKAGEVVRNYSSYILVY